MPARYGDPGVFACGPGDIAPWEQDTPGVQTSHRSPVSARAPRAVWLVLRACPDCSRVYCRRHDSQNWWLTEYNGPPFGFRRAISSPEE